MFALMMILVLDIRKKRLKKSKNLAKLMKISCGDTTEKMSATKLCNILEASFRFPMNERS